MTRSAHTPLRIDLAGGWTDVPAFAEGDGGAVVSMTIDKHVRAQSDVPVGGAITGADAVTFRRDIATTGLGASACEHVLVQALRNPDADLDEIAEAAFAAESAEGVAGGRQDQYAACYGGLNFLTFPSGEHRRAERARTGADA
ncbi:MAG: hypothetical protein ACREMU_06300, partial [Gemmatimonadaceae bacterium]